MYSCHSEIFNDPHRVGDNVKYAGINLKNIKSIIACPQKIEIWVKNKDQGETEAE